MQRVLAALQPFLAVVSFASAALLGDAEPADELLGGDAVELDRAGLGLASAGDDARRPRAPPGAVLRVYVP